MGPDARACLEQYLHDRRASWERLRAARAGRGDNAEVARRLARDHFADRHADIGPFGPRTAQTRAPDETTVRWFENHAVVEHVGTHEAASVEYRFVQVDGEYRIASATWGRLFTGAPGIAAEVLGAPTLTPADRACLLPHLAPDAWTRVGELRTDHDRLFVGDGVEMLAPHPSGVAGEVPVHQIAADGRTWAVAFGRPGDARRWHSLGSNGVDSGSLCAMTVEVAEALTDAKAEELGTQPEDPMAREGIWHGSTGRGDGRYPAYLGEDANGRPCCLLLDFTEQAAIYEPLPGRANLRSRVDGFAELHGGDPRAALDALQELGFDALPHANAFYFGARENLRLRLDWSTTPAGPELTCDLYDVDGAVELLATVVPDLDEVRTELGEPLRASGWSESGPTTWERDGDTLSVYRDDTATDDPVRRTFDVQAYAFGRTEKVVFTIRSGERDAVFDAILAAIAGPDAPPGATPRPPGRSVIWDLALLLLLASLAVGAVLVCW